MQDLKVVSATLLPPKPCSAGERRALVVDRVKAKLHARETNARSQYLLQEVILMCLDEAFHPNCLPFIEPIL